MTPDQGINRIHDLNRGAGKNGQKRRRRRNKLPSLLTNSKTVEACQTWQKNSFICARDENLTGNIVASTYLIDLVKNAANADDPVVQLAALKQCRKFISQEKGIPIDEIISAGILPILIQNLSRADNLKIQSESACTIADIISMSSTHTNTVVEAGAVPDLIQLPESPHENICQQAVNSLGDIICHEPVLRDFVIDQGIVKPFLNLVKPKKPFPILLNVAWVIKNLCNESTCVRQKLFKKYFFILMN